MTRKQMTTSKPATTKKTNKNSSKQPTRRNWRYLDVVVALVFVVAIGFSVKYNFFNDKNAATANADICYEPGITETVYLDKDSFSKQSIELERCAKLLIVNNDSLQYDLAIGTRDKHADYSGFKRQIVKPGEYVELDAIEPAALTMHDHLRDNASLQITVRP